jgi:hypothetical protein
MMVHRTGGTRDGKAVGNLEIERQITQLGKTRKERRIRRSLESRPIRKATPARATPSIDKLVADQRWDVLRAYRDKASSRRRTCSPPIGRARPLARSPANEAPSVPLGPHRARRPDGSESRSRLGAVSRRLARVRGKRTRSRYLALLQGRCRTKAAARAPDGRPGHRPPERAVAWDDLYDRWGTSNADWMHLRRALSRFGTLHTGDKYSKFARKLRQIVPAKKVKKRRPNLLDRASSEAIVARMRPRTRRRRTGCWRLPAYAIGEYLASGPDRHLDCSEPSGTRRRRPTRTRSATSRCASTRAGGRATSRPASRRGSGIGGCVSTGCALSPRAYRRRSRSTTSGTATASGRSTPRSPSPRCRARSATRARRMTRDYVMQAGTLDVSSGAV